MLGFSSWQLLPYGFDSWERTKAWKQDSMLQGCILHEREHIPRDWCYLGRESIMDGNWGQSSLGDQLLFPACFKLRSLLNLEQNGVVLSLRRSLVLPPFTKTHAVSFNVKGHYLNLEQNGVVLSLRRSLVLPPFTKTHAVSFNVKGHYFLFGAFVRWKVVFLKLIFKLFFMFTYH